MARTLRRCLAMGLLTWSGAFLVPACTIRIGPGGDDVDPWTSSGDGNDGGNEIGTEDTAGDEPTELDEESAAELFSRVEPEELALASAKATVATCALSGTLETLPLDPASLDEATLIALMEQYMPVAVEQTDLWLASVDASAFPPMPIPKYECEGDYGCQRTSKCTYGFNPGVSHRCHVVDCGPSRCSWCPSWVLEVLDHLALKAWCAYVCVQTGVSPAPTVAVAAGGISSFSGNFVGPICVPLW